MANETNGRCGTKYMNTPKEKWDRIFSKNEEVELNNLDELLDTAIEESKEVTTQKD